MLTRQEQRTFNWRAVCIRSEIAQKVSNATDTEVDFSGKDWDKAYVEVSKVLGLLDRMGDSLGATDLSWDGVSPSRRHKGTTRPD